MNECLSPQCFGVLFLYVMKKDLYGKEIAFFFLMN